MQQEKLKMKLQLLASDGAENNAENNTEENTGKEQQSEQKVLTQEQFDKALTKRLEKERKKMLEEFKTQLEEEKRLASLTEAEKLEEQKRQIEEERKAIQKEKMTTYAQRKLAEAKLPEAMLKYLVKDTTEDIDAEIESFSNIYNTSVNAMAEAKIGAGAPKTKTGTKIETPVDSFLKGLGL